MVHRLLSLFKEITRSFSSSTMILNFFENLFSVNTYISQINMTLSLFITIKLHEKCLHNLWILMLITYLILLLPRHISIWKPNKKFSNFYQVRFLPNILIKNRKDYIINLLMKKAKTLMNKNFQIDISFDFKTIFISKKKGMQIK